MQIVISEIIPGEGQIFRIIDVHSYAKPESRPDPLVWFEKIRKGQATRMQKQIFIARFRDNYRKV